MIVILDRDGVINEDSPNFIKSPSEWRAIPGSLEAIAAWNRAGHPVVVATNQSGICRGYFSLATLMAIHQKMHTELARCGGHLDGVYFCPHRSEDQCPCRKPQPGMLQQIARDFAVDLCDTWLIGDSLRDIQAAQAAGCHSILVKSGKGRETLAQQSAALQGIPVYENLASCPL
jgi:D-glycero-D-manno-heptose 1,7-bisphosphate phosphatase